MLTSKAIGFLLGVLALLGATLPRAGLAQGAELPFVRYPDELSLSNNDITALANDQRGFLWVGTVNGLNRFDGVQVRVFKRTGRPEDLPSNYIMRGGIVPDARGYLWVATNRGLYRFDPVRERGVTVPLPQLRDQQADNDFVSPLHFDRAGQGWFASASHLHRLDPRTLRLTSFALPYVTPNHYPEPFFDAAGRLWLLSEAAVYWFDAATRRYIYCQGRDQQHPQGEFAINTLFLGQRGTWYAATQQGLRCYQAATGRFEACADWSGTGTVEALAEAPATARPPVLWLGGVGELGCFEPARPRQTHLRYQPQNPNSYPGGVVLSLLPDPRTGMLWVGTTHGLAALDPHADRFDQLLLPTAAQPDGPETVQLVVQDPRRDALYWVVTQQAGLWRWQRPGGQWQLVGRPAGVPGPLLDAAPDAQGQLWVCFEDALGTYDPARQRWRIHRRFGKPTPGPSPPGPALRTLYRDRQQRLWLATQQGLYWFDPRQDRLVPYDFPAAIGPVGPVRRLQEDPQGRLWVLTSQGLFRVAADRRHVQRIQIGPLAPEVQRSDRLQSTFLLDRAGNIWLSGIDFVVQADSTGRVRQTYTLRNGLRADHTFGLAEATNGHLWLATDEQLHELNPITGQFRYYNRANGLLTNSRQPFTSNRQGELFLGGEGGFNYFQPSQLRRNPVVPPVALTEVRVNNQPRPLRPDNTVELRPGETTLTVGFTALNFSQAAKNRYAFRLLDFDPGWTITDARSATYTNLAPGTYQLRIRAANNDGIWNNRGQTLTIHVRPAYYQTLWFKGILLLTATAILWGVYRYRQAQRRQLARVRDHIAKDLHDDIGSTLSSIRIFSEVAQGQLGGAHPQTLALLQRISGNASTLAESMQDIIWTIKPNQDGLADLVSRMREFGLRLTEAKGIAFTMEVAEPFPVLQLSLEQRRTLYLVFKESVNNAVKHAACQHLRVALGLNGRQLELRITDDGQGFDPATARAGNGLANLQTRARDIGGRVQITSAPAAGTSVVLVAPL